jgi:hypothetical protein
VPKDWKGLDWLAFNPLIKCGRQSLRVFCVGLFPSFLGYFLMTISSGTGSLLYVDSPSTENGRKRRTSS